MKNIKKTIIFITIIIAIIVLLIFSAFFINAHNIKVRKETIASKKVDKNLDGLLILYFADLHYDDNRQAKDIELIEKKINDFKPDIIIFGGDLLSENDNDTSKLETFLTNIKAKSGKYAILGDEDVNNDLYKEILEKADFKLLSNQNDKLYINDSFINIVGIDPSIKGNANITQAYEGVNNEYFTFVVTHCPDLADKLDFEKSDYILSGHSLGGQVYLPLINLFYRERGCQNYFRGKNVINDITLDITNGLGTKEKDIRLFASPEIVFYKLTTIN